VELDCFTHSLLASKLTLIKEINIMTSTTTKTAKQNGAAKVVSITQPATTASPAPDEFDSAEFEQGRESLPYLQMLNHQDPEQSGFFITSENRSAVNFMPTAEWSLHRTTFQNGEVVEGYRSSVARFLILRQSKLMMFDRESGEFVREFRKGLYDRATMVLKVRYLVYLVNQQKQLLHEKPLQFTTKGSFCGSFGEVVRDFQDEMSKAYGAATGAKKPRGDRFMALSVLAVHVQPELKGDKQKSWVCSVTNHGIPVPENWYVYFVGYDAALKARILAEFDAGQQFDQSNLEATSPVHSQGDAGDDETCEEEAAYDDF
jgi:Family of unknown function (DUF5895)